MKRPHAVQKHVFYRAGLQDGAIDSIGKSLVIMRAFTFGKRVKVCWFLLFGKPV